MDINALQRALASCQSRLVNMSDGKTQPDGWLQDRYGWTKRLLLHEEDARFSTLPSYSSGASMIVRRTALELVDGFDPELFYGDYDLCWRSRMAGYGVGAAP